MYPQQMSENSKMKGIDTILSVKAKKLRIWHSRITTLFKEGLK